MIMLPLLVWLEVLDSKNIFIQMAYLNKLINFTIMEENKLNELIDKTVGTKGNLQIPSYWMNKTLKDIINHVNTQDQNIDFSIQHLLERTSDLQNRLNHETNFKIEDVIIASEYGGEICRVRANYYNKLKVVYADSANVSLVSSVSGGDIVLEYIIEVDCTELYYDSLRLGFPDTVKWLDGTAPQYKKGGITLIKIINGLGTWQLFE